MKRATDLLEDFGDLAKRGIEFTGLTLGLDGLKDSLVSAAEGGEQLQQLSARMGTTVASLSQLQYAAEATNVPFQTLTGAIGILDRNLVQASEGTGRARQALADLNIDAAKLASLPLDQQLDIIADAIARMPDPTQQTAAAMRLLSNSGADLLPILRQGSDGIEQLRARADALGVTMSADGVEALAKYNSAMTDLHASTHALWTELTADAAPALTSFTNTITKSIGDIRGMFDAVTGTGSAQSQIAGLTTQAKELSDRIDNLKSRSGWLSGLINPTLIKQDQDLLDGLNKKIADLTPLEPVTVTATKMATAGPDLTDVVVRATKINEDYMQQYYDKLNVMSQTDVEQTVNAWQAKEDAARQLLSDGVIDATEFQTRMEAINESFLQPLTVSAKSIAGTTKTVYEGMQKYAEAAANSIQSSFATFLEDPSISTFKKMGDAWLQTLDKMAADAAASSIFKAVFQGDNTPSGGLSGLLGGLLGGLFGGAGGGSSANVLDEVTPQGSLIGNFANGGSFDVGGSGGPDSQLVQFKGTPGENVQVGQNGGGAPITLISYTTVTSPQVTQAQVVAAVAQGQTSTINRMKDMKRRGKF